LTHKDEILSACAALQYDEYGKKKMSFSKAWELVKAEHPEWFVLS